MPDSPTILLVDDEDSVQKLLTYPLERDGFRVVQARDGEEALRGSRTRTIDLVVLDMMLPRLDGLEVCKRLRAESTVPIIMLTARDDELDKVLGLELGADDYITKPFSIREFRSRVRALLRRAATLHARERRRRGDRGGRRRIDVPRRTVEVRRRAVQLTFVEFELLRAARREPGPRLLAPAAAGAAPRRRRLPRATDDRRPRAPSAREDRARPARAGADPHRARRRLPLSRPMSAARRDPAASSRWRCSASSRGALAARLPDRRPDPRDNLVDAKLQQLEADAVGYATNTPSNSLLWEGYADDTAYLLDGRVVIYTVFTPGAAHPRGAGRLAPCELTRRRVRRGRRPGRA